MMEPDTMSREEFVQQIGETLEADSPKMKVLERATQTCPCAKGDLCYAVALLALSKGTATPEQQRSIAAREVRRAGEDASRAVVGRLLASILAGVGPSEMPEAETLKH